MMNKKAANYFRSLCLIGAIVLSMSGFNGFAQSINVGKTGPKGKALAKYVDPAELKKLVDNPADSIWIIDVRSEKAFQKEHIPTAKSFPASEIIDRLDEIPENQYLILYCVVGGSAQVVLKKLKRSGYKRTMNWGGLSRWEWDREKSE